MHTQEGTFFGKRSVQAWWPETIEQVQQLINAYPIVMLWQCPDSLKQSVKQWSFRSKLFTTPVIQLSKCSDDIWTGMNQKSCRSEIRKAERLEFVITSNNGRYDSLDLLNESIRRIGYRSELTRKEWDSLLETHDVHTVRFEDTPVATHVIMRHHPYRARLLLSACQDRNNESFRKLIGPANRLLHWHEIQHYQNLGYDIYDFGGCDLDPQHPEYLITKFKLSFGTEILHEHIVYLTADSVLRRQLKFATRIRECLRSIPWPSPMLRYVRKSRNLSSIFH